MPDYKLIASQIASLAEIDRDFVPVLSNAAALLYEGLERINWAGFYLLDRGSLSATTIVTNVQDFITIVAKGLDVI